MSIASTIALEDTIHLKGDHGGPKYVSIHVGSEFFHNTQGDVDGYQVLETALNERLGRRSAGVLYKNFEALHMSHLEQAYHVNFTILVSWYDPTRTMRNVTRAFSQLDRSDNAQQLMRQIIPLRREEVRALFQVHMGDVLPKEWIDRLTEYYLTDFLGKKRERQKKA